MPEPQQQHTKRRWGDPTTVLTQVLYRSAPSESLMDILALAVAAPSRQDRRIAAADALEASQARLGAGGRPDCCARAAAAEPTRQRQPADRPASGMDRSVSS